MFPKYAPVVGVRQVPLCMWVFVCSQMEFDEKDLRREISYAIKNIHGVRQVPGRELPYSLHLRGATVQPVGPPSLRVP